jgi:anti-sigma-K factor RskA
MELDHERIEELLAGYALLSLDGEDAVEADRLLAEHVPTCLRCRQTLADFQDLAGDIGLAPSPTLPPELLLPRIHRGIDTVPVTQRSRRRAYFAVAASVAALVAMGGLSFTMANRASRAETRTQTALGIVNALRSPNVTPVTLAAQGSSNDASSFLEVATPDVRTLYLVTDSCPQPEPGMAYQLWLGENGSFVPYGPMFQPDELGRVLLELEVDMATYDEIWITEEAVGTQPTEPNAQSAHAWRATLDSAEQDAAA